MNYSKESVKQLFNALINLEDPDKEFSMFELGWKVGASSWNANQPLDLIAKRALMTRLLKITLPNPSKQDLEDSISQLINELKTEVNVDILPSEIIPKDAHDFHYIEELYYQAKKRGQT